MYPIPRSPVFTDCLGVQDLNASNADLVGNILDLEMDHQGVFLGLDGAVRQLEDTATYNTWSNTAPNLVFDVYLDTHPPTILTEHKGLWDLGNRFIASAREVLFLTLYNSSSQIL